MPSNQSPLGAPSARFRRHRLLIVGCGDVGARVLKRLTSSTRAFATTSQVANVAALRSLGATPIVANLDDPRQLRRLSGIATHVLHLAPPPTDAFGGLTTDPRTLNLIRALRLRSAPMSLTYGSTSGVYGDCQGQWVNESRPVNPATARAHRRVDAETAVRFFGLSAGVRVGILRIPGIYAADRVGGTPRERLQRGTPVLQARDDVYTNHIHAEDLARACLRALHLSKPQRTYNISDNTDLKMGEYFDLAADLYGLPRPPRVSRELAPEKLSLMVLSFMSESRRLDNKRMTQELKLTLKYPDVATGLV